MANLFGYIVVMAVMVVSFQNCSMQSTHEISGSLSAKTCETILKNTYRETYYSTFRTSCVSCHATGGEAGSGRWFASANFEEGYGYFKSLGRSKIESQALNAGHKAPNTGPHHAAMINGAQNAWAQADAINAQCEQAASAAIDTISKVLPATVYSVATPPADGVAWPRLTFNLMSEIQDNALKNQIGLTISLEVRRARMTGSTTDVGYEFRNPRALVAGNPLPTLRIKTLKLLKNGLVMTDFTTYDNLNFVAGPNAAGAAVEQVMQVGSNGLMVTSPIANTDAFVIRIGGVYDATGSPIGGGQPTDPVGPGLPTRVTYNELAGGNNTLNVFVRNCNGCHGAANPAGGLNLTTFATTSPLAQTIQARMNNMANPMPPSGILGGTAGIRDRELVNIWINSGAPQN